MDSELLFWLVLVAVYLLQAIAGKKKKKQQQLQQQLPTSENTVLNSDYPEPEVTDAISEISKILQKATSPEWPPLPHELPETEQERPELNVKAARKPLHPLSEAKFYDEAFEQENLNTFHAPEIVHDHKSEVQEPPTLENSLSHLVHKDTHSQNRLKEAIILADVLGPPKGRRSSS